MKTRLPAVMLILAITACTQPPPPADPSVITSRSAAWEAALNAGDVDGVVTLYTADARVLPPNREMVHGSAGVRAEFGAMIDAGLSGDLTSVETAVQGDIGYNVGTFVLRDGDTVVDRGKFIETWQRGSDGQWRISNDIYNSDLPVAAMEEPKTHILITHEVDDADHWLAAWRGDNSRHQLFENNGAAHVHTFVSPDNPNLTGLVVAVNDMAALEAMLASPEGQAAAAEDGVRWDTLTMMPQKQ